MVKIILQSNKTKSIDLDDPNYLNVVELYFNTIQGEGIHTGCPSVFLRLQYCTLNCKYCDTINKNDGASYTFEELFSLMITNGIIEKLKQRHHLVITGGSPLLQQERLTTFIRKFFKDFGFYPIIEIENECTIMPSIPLTTLVNTWNNSPKLSNSGNPVEKRYKPRILRSLSVLPNSWFKFVITDWKDWAEIQDHFLNESLIKKEQIMLMPQGKTRDEVIKNSEIAINLAVKFGVRYCSREHIIMNLK